MNRLTTQEAADYVRLSKSTLDKLRVAGGGPIYIKYKRKVFYDTADLDSWMDGQKQASTADVPAAAPVSRKRRARRASS
jgi:hypothetical protein